MRPFEKVFKKYYDNNYSIMPAGEKQQSCKLKGWTNFCKERMPIADLESWIPNAYNITLACGYNVIALDFDYNIDGLHEEIEKLIPKSPLIKKGSKGFTAFYKYNGEPNRSWKKDNKAVFEILSRGHQTCLPPSMHPKGMKYIWLEGSMESIEPKDLPTLPFGLFEKIDELFGIKKYEPKPLRLEDLETDPAEILEAIDYISPDCSHDDWINVGMAVHNYFKGSNEGLNIWDNWSRNSNKYKNSECNSRYKSFGEKGNKITISTLFYLAKLNGYIKNIYKSEEIRKDINIDWDSIFKKEKKSINKSFDKSLLNAPGLVGDIENFINKTSLFNQPILSLSAAITAAGTIFSHKIKSETDLRTNFYCLSVAETGSGKDHPRKSVVELFKKCGIKHLFCGKPASSAGLLSGLEDNNGKGLIQLDEFGHFLGSVNKTDNPKFLQGIPSILTELFTSASTTFLGDQYSNKTSNKNTRVDIEQPCLNVLGSTVPDRLYKSLSLDEVIDGFLTRWIIFESIDYSPEINIYRENLRDCNPEKLIKKIRDVRNMPENCNISNSSSEFLEINPTLIHYTNKARDLVMEYFNKIKKKREDAIKNNDPIKNIYTRSWEHMIKLALVANEDFKITEKSVKWAIGVIEYSNNKFINILKHNISNSKYENDCNFVYNCFKDKWISKSEISRKAQKLNKRTRNEILEDLLEQGKIIGKKEGKITLFKKV